MAVGAPEASGSPVLALAVVVGCGAGVGARRPLAARRRRSPTFRSTNPIDHSLIADPPALPGFKRPHLDHGLAMAQPACLLPRPALSDQGISGVDPRSDRAPGRLWRVGSGSGLQARKTRQPEAATNGSQGTHNPRISTPRADKSSSFLYRPNRAANAIAS